MLNGYRLAGDSIHSIAILLLLGHIFRFRNKSCAGISGKSRILYAIVYCTRYLDLFSYFVSIYNSSMKIFFISSSLLIIYFLYFQYGHDKENDSVRIEFMIALTFILSVWFTNNFIYQEILWTFSIFLEAVAIVPQLVLTYKIGKAEGFVWEYLIALGSYRAFYIANWYYRYVHEDYVVDVMVARCGVVQTAFYCVFFCAFVIKTMKAQRREEGRKKMNIFTPIFTIPVDESNTNRLQIYANMALDPRELLLPNEEVKEKTIYIPDQKEEVKVEVEGQNTEPSLKS